MEDINATVQKIVRSRRQNRIEVKLLIKQFEMLDKTADEATEVGKLLTKDNELDEVLLSFVNELGVSSLRDFIAGHDRKTSDTKTGQSASHDQTSETESLDVTLIGTFNVRTAREEYKRLELATQFLESGMDILGLQEHRIIHEEPIKIQRFNMGVCLVTISAWENRAGSATGGVGFLLSSKAYNAISLPIKPLYGPRVLKISFDGNPMFTAITSYCPTDIAHYREAKKFHKSLQHAMADVPDHHMLITNGDMNARLGKEYDADERCYFGTDTNRNGDLLRETAEACDMEITNTRFSKETNKMWTFLFDSHLTKLQIDYILIRRKWTNSLKDTEAYNTFHSLGSDHRVVISKVKLSFRPKSKMPPKMNPQYDLRRGYDIDYAHAVEVRYKFSCLVEEDDEATERYAKLVEAIDTANKGLLSRQIAPSSDPRVVEARRKLFSAMEMYHENPTKGKREKVATKKKQLTKQYTKVEKETQTGRKTTLTVPALSKIC